MSVWGEERAKRKSKSKKHGRYDVVLATFTSDPRLHPSLYGTLREWETKRRPKRGQQKQSMRPIVRKKCGLSAKDNTFSW